MTPTRGTPPRPDAYTSNPDTIPSAARRKSQHGHATRDSAGEHGPHNTPISGLVRPGPCTVNAANRAGVTTAVLAAATVRVYFNAGGNPATLTTPTSYPPRAR